MDIQHIIIVAVVLMSIVYIGTKVPRYFLKYPDPKDLVITNTLSFIISFCILYDVRNFHPITVVFVLVFTGTSLLIHLVLWFRLLNPKLWHKLFDNSKMYQERKDE